MTGSSKTASAHERSGGAYGPGSDIVDFILGITFEIWEQRGVDLIHGYYAPDVEVFSLDGLISGAQAMVDGTRATLEAFPDRLLIGDNVVWSGDRESGYYSSHRITSPMTNHGPSAFGPATGKRVQVTNIADCVVENGVITREWLLRDNLALVRQLGIDAMEAARRLAAGLDERSRAWLRAETLRVNRAASGASAADRANPGLAPTAGQSTPGPATAGQPGPAPGVNSAPHDARPAADFNAEAFARHLLGGLWEIRPAAQSEDRYAPYAVMHRSPVERYSGREAILDHYADLSRAFGNPRVSLDHVACQPFGSSGWDIAARWTLAGEHAGTFCGLAATGKPVFVLGVSHWRLAAQRVAAEWTVFDQLAVLGQLLD